MALINCQECDKEISSAAPSCPNCGFPSGLSHKHNRESVVTGQQTGKQLKLHTLCSVLLFSVGAFWIFKVANTPSPEDGAAIIPALLTLVGIVWYSTTRFRIWWNHK